VRSSIKVESEISGGWKTPKEKKNQQLKRKTMISSKEIKKVKISLLKTHQWENAGGEGNGKFNEEGAMANQDRL